MLTGKIWWQSFIKWALCLWIASAFYNDFRGFRDQNSKWSQFKVSIDKRMRVYIACSHVDVNWLNFKNKEKKTCPCRLLDSPLKFKENMFSGLRVTVVLSLYCSCYVFILRVLVLDFRTVADTLPTPFQVTAKAFRMKDFVFNNVSAHYWAFSTPCTAILNLQNVTSWFY